MVRPGHLGLPGLLLGLMLGMSACGPSSSVPFDLQLFPDQQVDALIGGDALVVGPDGDAGPLPDGPAGDPSPGVDVAGDTGGEDLPPPPPDLPPPDYPPSTANVGWIGGACEVDADCEVAGGTCLRTPDFPNGMCTAPCDSTCPDRSEPGDTVTFCADGIAYGLPAPLNGGFCVARCDTDVLPGSGCPAGYRCASRNRFTQPAALVDVCVPLASQTSSCEAGPDVIAPVPYPDRGTVWIPAEARCGGAFDLVVLLHGINPDSVVTPSLGGGRHLEVLVRSLIDQGRMRPVILAEPVHFEPGSTTLYGAGFDLTTHLDLVKAELAPYGISLRSLSYTGHSGAGCDPDNGLYKVLAELGTLVPTYAPELKLWGLEDICYGGTYHYADPLGTLAGTGTVILNMFSVQGDPAAFEAGLIPDPDPLDCDTDLYSSCITHPSERWCSYRTRSAAGIGHDNNPYFFTREAFPRVFTDAPTACR